MRIRFLVSGLLLLALLRPTTADEAEKLDLSWRPTAGETSDWRAEWATKTKASRTGSRPAASETRLVLEWRDLVRDVKGDRIAVERTITAVAWRVRSPLMTFAFDSRKKGHDDETPLAVRLAALVGRTFTVETDVRGRVHAVTGWSEVLDAVLGGANAADAMTAAFLRGILEPERTTDPLVAGFRLRPGGPVAAGEGWTGRNEVRIGTGGADRLATLVFANGFTYRRPESIGGRRGARIDATADVTAPPPDAAAADGTWHVTEVGDAKVEATTILDVDTGAVAKETVEADLELTEKHVASASGPPPAPAVEKASPFAKVKIDMSFTLERIDD